MVMLSRTENHGNWAVGGITDAHGVAVIHTSYTNFTEPGAPAGMFKVTIDKALPPITDTKTLTELQAMDYNAIQEYQMKQSAEADKRPLIVPKKYANVSLTSLTIEIKPDGKTEESFDVEK